MINGQIDPNYSSNLIGIITKGEGFKANIYADIFGIPTIGKGFALIVRTSNGSFRVRSQNRINSLLSGTSATVTAADYALLQNIENKLNSGVEKKGTVYILKKRGQYIF